MRPLVRIAKALGDNTRVRIISALHARELCVCQIVEMLKLAHSTVSKHLSILSQAGLVECHKNGRWIHYRLSKGEPSAMASKMTALVLQELKNDEAAMQDKKSLTRILSMDTEKLCSLQRKKREA